MYPWVTHTHAHLEGECPHRCSYCYVQAMARRFASMRLHYAGPPRLVADELHVCYGSGKTIFVEHMGDLFASAINKEWIGCILDHCRQYPDNAYVFQSKNPSRLPHFVGDLPSTALVGTTIESNRHFPEVMRDAPAPTERVAGMVSLPSALRRFVTIEPILDFDVDRLVAAIALIRPEFVNIGADSKGAGLPEPSPDKVRDLIGALGAARIEIRRKTNLARLLGR